MSTSGTRPTGVISTATAGESVFDTLPAGKVSFALGDRPDREVKALLRRRAEAARASGRVVTLKAWYT